MEKVYILKWVPTGQIGGVYTDYKKATQIAEANNKKRTWRHRLYEALNGVANKWIVETFDVKD